MHRCLEVREILHLILTYIYDPTRPAAQRRDLSAEERTQLKTINSLARTCKSISGPSLDLLWYYQPDLKALCLCLPERVLGSIKRNSFDRLEFELKGDLLPSDCDRMEFYSRRIRVLGDTTSEGMPFGHWEPKFEYTDPMLYPTLLSKRATWGAGPLLPRLTQLNISLHEFSSLAWYPRLVAGPQLTSVNIAVWAEDLDNLIIKVHWANVSATLSAALPTLSTLTFVVHSLFTLEESDISILDRDPDLLRVIRTLAAPTVLDLISVPMDSETLIHLSTLQTITTLSLSIKPASGLDKPRLTSALSELRSLQELTVLANDQRFCSFLIHRLAPACLQTLRVNQAGPDEDIWDLDEFIGSLKDTRFTMGLRTLQVSRPLYDPSSDPEVPMITSQTIDRLSVFKRLISIRIYLNGDVALFQNDLETIATLWPHLQVLDFRSRTRNDECSIHLDDFLKAITSLPNLKEVRLRMDSRLDDIMFADSGLQITGVVAPQLKTFDVGMSPITQPEMAATLLGAAFPNLRHLKYGWKYLDSWGEEIVMDLTEEEVSYRDSWRTVQRMIKKLGKSH